MNDWVSKSLIALFLVVLLTPFAQQLLDRREYCKRTAGDCAGGGCGNLLILQETLERDTLRFRQPHDVPLRVISR